MRVRVSIANLGPTMTVPCGEIDSRHCIVILAPSSFKKGKKLWLPIGGAMEVTARGRQYLEEYCGASNFHLSQEKKIDARFEVEDSMLARIFAFFNMRNPDFYEIDPLREIREELSTELFPANEFFAGIPPVLTPEEAAELRVDFRLPIIQPFSDQKGESALAKEGLPNRRLFHYFDIEVPSREMFGKILASPAIRELSKDEWSSTEGGRHTGLTTDGEMIGDNVIDWYGNLSD